MADRSTYQKIDDLTERQIEVLSLVCEGKNYQQIADELFISKNTVKSHMVRIYKELGLDQLTREQRLKSIFEVYCPVLKSFHPVTRSNVSVKVDDEFEDEDVDEVIEGIVVDDESAIQVYFQQPMEAQPRPQQRGLLFVLGCGAVLFILVVGAVGLGFVLGNQFDLWGDAQTDVPQPASPTAEIAQVSTDVPVPTDTEEMVATPTQPEPTDVHPSSTPVVNVTVVQYTPTPVPESTNTPDLNTPPGSVLQAGEWWIQDDVWLRVKSAQLTEQGGIWIILEMWNQTSNPLTWQWNVGGNLSLTDNTGHIYIPTNQSSNLVGQTILDPGELSEVTLRSFGYSAVYQDPSFFNPGVTELILTVIGFPNIPEAKFRIPA